MTRAARLLTITAAMYIGAIVGFSFVATPAKFLAPGVEMSDLLLVGRATFGAFLWVEVVFVAALCVLAFTTTRARVVVATLILVVIVQHGGVRPVLDARVSRIVAGDSASPSVLHHVYALLEVGKLVLLGAACWGAGGAAVEGGA